MSTTVTETGNQSQANSLAIRGQPYDSEEDNKSQESYSTVIEPRSSKSEDAKQTKEAEKNKQIEDSDADEEEPSPCGRCRKMVIRGDEALQCEICSQWYHIKCERVTKPQYKQMQATKTKTNFHWYCDTCDIIQTGVIRQMTLFNAEQSQFKQRLDDLEKNAADKKEVQKELEKKADKEDLQKLEQRVTNLEEKANKEDVEEIKDKVQKLEGRINSTHENAQDSANPQPSTSSGGGNTMDEVIKEMKDQEDRKRNIIFFNIPESKSKDMNERVKHDKEEAKEITKICSATIKKDDMLKAKRLGKIPDDDKPRPLLIEVSSDEKKRALFKNLSKLQNAPDKYKTVSVRNDLTKKQREQEKTLREEAKKKEQEDSGEAKFKVRGPPWDRKIVKLPTKKSN